mmetsp:Transcript_3362/g.8630  ORF Transcript_3362/g.8630 Transcript_3362/m.8630 type:complete len:204 (+) Transcript_3362:2883-3494(+)
MPAGSVCCSCCHHRRLGTEGGRCRTKGGLAAERQQLARGAVWRRCRLRPPPEAGQQPRLLHAAPPLAGRRRRRGRGRPAEGGRGLQGGGGGPARAGLLPRHVRRRGVLRGTDWRSKSSSAAEPSALRLDRLFTRGPGGGCSNPRQGTPRGGGVRSDGQRALTWARMCRCPQGSGLTRGSSCGGRPRGVVATRRAWAVHTQNQS